MPTFTPPTTAGRLIADPGRKHRSGAHALWSHYGAWETGQTVWKDSLGVWHTSVTPYQGGAVHRVFDGGQLVSETAPDEGLATAQVVYLGGHVHEITDAEMDDLIAAGFRDQIVPDNLLDTAGTFEDGTVDTWQIQTGQAHEVVASTEQAHSGSWSLRVTSPASAPLSVWSHPAPGGFPVTPDETISGLFWLYPKEIASNPSATLDGAITLEWLTAAGAQVGTASGTAQAWTSAAWGTWYRLDVTATVPPTTEQARVGWKASGNAVTGERVYIDDAYVVRGATPYDPSTGWVD
jgi:hypothetical protein